MCGLIIDLCIDGYKRMNRPNFEVSMKALQWQHEEMEKEAIDEQAIRWVLLSVVYRNLDDLEKAKEYIQKTLTVDRYAFKGNFVDNWMCTSHPFAVSTSMSWE